jgi:hypothetical protein
MISRKVRAGAEEEHVVVVAVPGEPFELGRDGRNLRRRQEAANDRAAEREGHEEEEGVAERPDHPPHFPECAA